MKQMGCLRLHSEFLRYKPTVHVGAKMLLCKKGAKAQLKNLEKVRELSNQLGNVLVAVSDRKTPQYKTTGTAPNTVTTFSYFKASILSATDYYPFGMAMPGRQVSADKYRYGFNGKEKDKNINSGAIAFETRIYDGRLGRFLSVDFLANAQPHINPYHFVSNSPIFKKDKNGDFEVKGTSSDPKENAKQEKHLNAIGNNYIAHLKGLSESGSEMRALLRYSGYNSKEELVSAWEKKGEGAIVLSFSVHDESGNPTHQPSPSGLFVHPDGRGGLVGDLAISGGNGKGKSGGEITLSKSIFYLCENMYGGIKVTPRPQGGEKFDYDQMRQEGHLFINRIIGHEMTHLGADNNIGLSRYVWVYTMFKPTSWRNAKVEQTLFSGTAFQIQGLHRGDVFEMEAYGKIVASFDVEYGFAVNIYYRAMAGTGCQAPGVIQNDNQIAIARNRYAAYIKTYLENLFPRVFGDGSSSDNIGSYELSTTDH
jgi:RHS repeat-associated protein